MPTDIKAIVLDAPGVRLEPLAEIHREGLRRAAQAPAIWAHMPTPALGERFDVWFDGSLRACETPLETAWAVRTLDDKALVGSTRYLNIEAAHKRVEIGHTWYNPAVWAGQVNPACKFALLHYGFETLGLNRIELKTDIANTRSQAAIARLGPPSAMACSPASPPINPPLPRKPPDAPVDRRRLRLRPVQGQSRLRGRAF